MPLAVSASQLDLFRQLQVDIDACIISLPQGAGSEETGTLIGLPSLLESGSTVNERANRRERCSASH